MPYEALEAALAMNTKITQDAIKRVASVQAREKCSGADRYKAKRKPRCGCETCEAKWKSSPHRKPKLFELLVESIDEMKLTPAKKEFAKAVMRAALEYAAMRQAGFVLAKPK